MELLKAEPVPFPPLAEQQAIARFLDRQTRRIDRYIRAKRKQIALLNEYKQAIIHQAVTRGLDPNAPLKPSGIDWLGDIPAHWSVRKLKNLARVQTGITLGKTYEDSDLRDLPYLRVANVQAGFLNLDKITTVRVPSSEAKRSRLKTGDVLMTEGGDIDKLGRGTIWNGEIEECLHQNHVFAVRPHAEQLRPEYLVALMGSAVGRRYFQITAKQTTNLAATNSTTLGRFAFALPEISEQDEILARIRRDTESIDSLLQRETRQVQLIQEFRTRLVADAVTGQAYVRNHADAVEHHPDDDVLDASDESLTPDDPKESDELDIEAQGDIDE